MPPPRRRRQYRHLHPVGQRIAAAQCAAGRRVPGFHRPDPRRVEAPYGYRLVEDRAAADARLETWAANAPGRADGRATRAAVARALARQRRYDPAELAIPAGHQQLADEAGRLFGVRVSRQSAQRVVAELVDAGILHVAVKGCSAAVTGTRNHVSVYVVIEPDTLDEQAQQAVDELAARLDGHLPVGVVDLGTSGGGEILEVRGKIDRQRSRPLRRQHPNRFAVREVTEARATAAWLLGWLGWDLGTGAELRLAVKLRPFFAAGWTGDALAVATQRPPAGPAHARPLQNDEGIVRREAVLFHRLGLWRNAQRRPLPPPVGADLPRRGPQSARQRAEQHQPPSSATLPTSRAPGAAARVLLAAAGLVWRRP